MTTLDGDVPCRDCGTRDNIIWVTDNILWNALCPNVGILCVRRFIRRAEEAGCHPDAWRLLPLFAWSRAEEPGSVGVEAEAEVEANENE